VAEQAARLDKTPVAHDSASLGPDDVGERETSPPYDKPLRGIQVIMRVYDYAGDEQCATGGKITGESLVVTGLKGYEIHETVDVKSTPNANLKARELADKAYLKTKS